MIGTRTILMRRAVERFLSTPGSTGNYAGVADNPPLDITGDIDIDVQVALNDWTPAATTALLGKFSGTTASFLLRVGTTGTVVLTLTEDGTTPVSATSSASVSAANERAIYVRATWQQSDGRVQFFTSQDGEEWTQLGTDQTLSVTSIHSGTALLDIGSYGGGTASPAAGKFYRVRIFDGFREDDGTRVLDIDFTRPRVGAITFTEDSPNHYLVTINQSGANPARILS